MIPVGFDKKVLVPILVDVNCANERCECCLRNKRVMKGICGDSRKRHVPDGNTRMIKTLDYKPFVLIFAYYCR